jgi:hypothetical protein
MNQLTTIGRVEKVSFPTLGSSKLYARIDTGAKTSSIWASKTTETEKGLEVEFAQVPHEIAAFKHTFEHYTRVKVASSMGHEQVRYKIKIPVVIKGRRIIATFTLADRQTQVYPVLIGRSTLMRKFVVDVSKGTPLRKQEKERSDALQSTIQEEKV